MEEIKSGPECVEEPASAEADDARIEDSLKAMLGSNPYVTEVSGCRITYTDEFYEKMYSLTHGDGRLTYVRAYEDLGFDTDILGEDRANSAGRRAARRFEKLTVYGISNTEDEKGDSFICTFMRVAQGDEFLFLKTTNTRFEEILRMQERSLNKIVSP